MKSIVNLTSAAIPKAHAPANDDTEALITLSATAGVRHVVDLVTGGYSEDPTDGSLTVTATVKETSVAQIIPIVNGGGFVLRFDPPLQGDENTAITISLAAGSGTAFGKINAMTR